MAPDSRRVTDLERADLAAAAAAAASPTRAGVATVTEVPGAQSPIGASAEAAPDLQVQPEAALCLGSTSEF